MLRQQAISRQHIVTDWYIINGNNTYIQRWSILMITVIFGCGGLQVIKINFCLIHSKDL